MKWSTCVWSLGEQVAAGSAVAAGTDVAYSGTGWATAGLTRAWPGRECVDPNLESPAQNQLVLKGIVMIWESPLGRANTPFLQYLKGIYKGVSEFLIGQ